MPTRKLKDVPSIHSPVMRAEPKVHILERYQELQELDRQDASVPGPYHKYLRRESDKGNERRGEPDPDTAEQTAHRYESEEGFYVLSSTDKLEMTSAGRELLLTPARSVRIGNEVAAANSDA